MRPITTGLIKLLDRVQNPNSVKALKWALEKSTGFSTDEVAADWYRRHGFYRLAGEMGQSSYAGKLITVDSALECTPMYAGVKMIAEDLGTLPFHTYERSADRKSVERATSHPLYRALHDLANPEVSAGSFVEAMTAQALLTGNAYAFKERMQRGVYLFPWEVNSTREEKNSSGVTFFIHREGNGSEKTYTRDQVFNLPGFTLNGNSGDEVLKRARHSLGLTAAGEEFAGRYFGQGAAPLIAIERPAGLVPWNAETVANFKKVWNEWHQGTSKSHGIAVIQEGAQVRVITPNAEQSQLIPQRIHQIQETCRTLRLPPHKLAELSHATFSNIEELNIEYVTMTLSPWTRRWRQSVYRCLLTEDEQLAGRLYAEHDVEGLLRGNFKAQSEGFRVLLEKGVYSINEVRRLLNLNPVDGGDSHFIQLNLTTAQQIEAGANLPTGLVPVLKEEV